MCDSFSGEFRFLSNFFLCPVIYEGVVYPSSEHVYMAAKTLDIVLREENEAELRRVARKHRQQFVR